MTDTLVVEVGTDRAAFVKARLLEINAHANSIIIENGMLLREYKDNGYYKSDGFQSFDEAINSYQASGLLDYGARNARNFIAIVDMIDAHGIDPKQIEAVGVSKLREIATLPDADQKKLLDGASDMTVAEVQKEAKRLRDKAHGRDTDPLSPVTLMLSETQKVLYTDCIKAARVTYGIAETAGDAAVLIDFILAEWMSGVHTA